MDITRREFETFKDVKESRATEKMTLTEIAHLSGLDWDVLKYMTIHYNELVKRFG